MSQKQFGIMCGKINDTSKVNLHNYILTPKKVEQFAVGRGPLYMPPKYILVRGTVGRIEMNK